MMNPYPSRTRHWAGVLIFIFACIIALVSCTTKTDPASDDQIPTGTLTDGGFDTAVVHRMTEAIRNGDYSNVHALLIAREGKLVYEEYFSGEDQRWGDEIGLKTFSRDYIHDLRSVSKSVVSACVGIAIAEGSIKDVGQSVFDFFPEYEKYKTGTRSQLTVEHLLTMSSGIRWNEEVPYDNPENSEVQMIQSGNPVEYVLSQPMDTIPGVVWKYNGGTTQLLASIIKKVSGMEVDEFAAKKLFEPMGITEFEWVHYPLTSIPAAASGLRLRAIDQMKFGLLYYNDGVFNGKQLLTKEWVASSFETHVDRSNGEGYGYQFWIWTDNYHGSENRMVVAVGNGDQRIFFNKAADLVVVVQAGNYNKWDIPNHPGKLLTDFIYPSIR